MHTHIYVLIKPRSPLQHHCTAQSAEVDSTAFGMEEMEAFWRRNRKALRRARADQLVHNWSVSGPFFINWGRFYGGYIYIHMYLSIYLNIHIYIIIYVYVCVYLSIYVYAYLCIYIYIYTWCVVCTVHVKYSNMI